MPSVFGGEPRLVETGKMAGGGVVFADSFVSFSGKYKGPLCPQPTIDIAIKSGSNLFTRVECVFIMDLFK